MILTTNTVEHLPARGLEASLRNWRLVTEQLRARKIGHFAVPEEHGYKIGVTRPFFSQLKRMLYRLTFTPEIIVEYQLHQCWHRYLAQLSPDRIMSQTARYRIYRKSKRWGRTLYGPEFACIVEIWNEHTGYLDCDYSNKIASRIPINSTKTICKFDSLTQIHTFHVDKRSALHVDFPIDIVYTWVDGSDPKWRKIRGQHQLTDQNKENRHPSADSEARYYNRDELRYSLRSVCMYVDFFRRVYLVTNGQIPDWLNAVHPDIRIVAHPEIFHDTSALPTFNSHAIESQLHHIDGLSEHFLYFNDDVFISRPLHPECFFTPNGLAKIFPSTHNIPIQIADYIDRPIDTAAQRTQLLLEKQFGRYSTHKPQHAPIALKRDVLNEMENIYQEEFTATTRSKFRTPTDISVAASLFAYFALNTHEAVPGLLKTRYIDINELLFPLLIAPFSNLARGKYDTFCLNEVEGGNIQAQIRDHLVSYFLSWRFPLPSPFELSG